MGANLFLYSQNKFIYEEFTDVASWQSVGTWSKKKDILKLNSNLEGTLPLQIIYLDSIPSEPKIKNLAIIKDKTGREYTLEAIRINNDSVSCFYGDMECFGNYTTIDSIKVTIGKNVSSRWVKVEPSKGIIQIVLQTDFDLTGYFPVDMRLKEEKGLLKRLKD